MSPQTRARPRRSALIAAIAVGAVLTQADAGKARAEAALSSPRPRSSLDQLFEPAIKRPPREVGRSRRASPASRATRAQAVPLPRPRPVSASLARASRAAIAPTPENRIAAAPMPPLRPAPEVPHPAPAAPPPAIASLPPPPPANSPAPAGPSACQARLGAVAVFKPLPPIAGPGACGADDVVELGAIILREAQRADVMPPATLRCGMAEAVAAWIRDDVAAATMAFGELLQGVKIAASFDCRGRNRVNGGQLSEHGRANAVDVRAVLLPNGKEVALTDASVAKEFRQRLKARACDRFATVLGPGSDGYHEEHVHLDAIERSSGYRLCQWDIREATGTAAAPLPPASRGPTGRANP